MWWFNRSRPSGPANEAKEPDPARRRVLFGIGAAACAVAVGTLPFGGEAHAAAAASPLDDLLDRIDGVDAAEDVELAHYTGYSHRHGYDRPRRRRRRRRARRDCRDPWFRRNNPRTCGVPRRRRRRRGYGRSCYRVGSVTVCD